MALEEQATPTHQYLWYDGGCRRARRVNTRTPMRPWSGTVSCNTSRGSQKVPTLLTGQGSTTRSVVRSPLDNGVSHATHPLK